jgi:hypothetical protein
MASTFYGKKGEDAREGRGTRERDWGLGIGGRMLNDE